MSDRNDLAVFQPEKAVFCIDAVACPADIAELFHEIVLQIYLTYRPRRQISVISDKITDGRSFQRSELLQYHQLVFHSLFYLMIHIHAGGTVLYIKIIVLQDQSPDIVCKACRFAVQLCHELTVVPDRRHGVLLVCRAEHVSESGDRPVAPDARKNRQRLYFHHKLIKIFLHVSSPVDQNLLY